MIKAGSVFCSTHTKSKSNYGKIIESGINYLAAELTRYQSGIIC